MKERLMSEPILETVRDRSDAHFTVPFTSMEFTEPRKRSRPWAICFVYTPDGNLVVKGDSDTVHKFVNDKFPLCLLYYTYWKNGTHRGGMMGKGIYVFERRETRNAIRNLEYFRNAKKSTRFAVTRDFKTWLYYRNLPKRWLPEWTEMPTLPRNVHER